jgi:hypothetical protein
MNTLSALSEEELEKEQNRLRISSEIREIKFSIYSKIIIRDDYKTRELSTIALDKNIEELIHLYKSKYVEIKPYLPNIKDVIENGILFVILTLHGVISNIPKSIKIPKSTVFIKAMTSDYGALSCDVYDTTMKDSLHYRMKSIISEKIHSRKEKRTRRNNIKFMKNTMKDILNEINKDMDINKGLKRHMNDLRYLISKGHVHYYEHGGKIAEKVYQIDFRGRDDYDKIYAINDKYPDLNLLHYLNMDTPTTLNKLFININMKDVFHLFEGIKYLFFVDQSCSAISNNNDFKANRAQTIAEELEGKSFTQNIINYENTSPYNIYETENVESYADIESNDDLPPPPTLKKGLARVDKSPAQDDENSRIGYHQYDTSIHNERRKKREAHSAKLKDAKLKDAKIIERMLRRYDARQERERAQKTGENYYYNWNVNNLPINKAHEEAYNNLMRFNPLWYRSTINQNRNRNEYAKTKKWWRFW